MQNTERNTRTVDERVKSQLALKIPIFEMMHLMSARPDWEWTFRTRNDIYKNRIIGSPLVIRIAFTCPCANKERLYAEQEIDELRAAQFASIEDYVEQFSRHLHMLMDGSIERHTAKWKRLPVELDFFFDGSALPPMDSQPGRRTCRRCREPLSGVCWERQPGRASSLLSPREVEFYCMDCGHQVQLQEDGK